MIKPQPGPQETFLTSGADIVFYGGAAGGGKTFSLLLDPLDDMKIPGFGAVLFRRTIPQITNEGALWDQSMNLYPNAQATPKTHGHYWVFPGGNTMTFAGMEHEKNMFDWQGAEIAWIGFDELTHFTRKQFFYMLSRNRSMCGVKPRIRAGMNPDKKSWVRKFIEWWIYPKAESPTGRATPIPERSGVIRYFIVENDEVIWKDSPDEFPNAAQAKSFTFIGADVYDNKILLEKDPGYLANLQALPKVERDKLLGGDWDAEDAPGEYFKRSYFQVVKAVDQSEVSKVVRFWDRAATKNETSAWTVGLKLAKMKNGSWAILHVERFRGTPGEVRKAIRNTAVQDGKSVAVWLVQDPGQAGIADVQSLIRFMAGFVARAFKETGDKVTRALPVSAQAEAGNILIVEGSWNDNFFTEAESFPLGFKDQIDALSGGYTVLESKRVGEFTEDMAALDKEDRLEEW